MDKIYALNGFWEHLCFWVKFVSYPLAICGVLYTIVGILGIRRRRQEIRETNIDPLQSKRPN